MSTKDWIRFWVLGLIWGTSFLWIKIAVGEVSPFVLVGFRTLFGVLGLLVVLWFTRQAGPPRAELRQQAGVFAVAGLINVALPFVLISWGEQHISSGLASILNSTVPLFTFVISALILRDEPVKGGRVLGLLVGFAGVVVLFWPELANGKMDSGLLGQLAMLVAALCYAAGIIYVRHKGQRVGPQMQSLLQLTAATTMMWALTLIVERPVRLPVLPVTWIALLWLGLLGSCVAYILYFGLLKTIGSTRTTMVTYIPPLVGVVLGALFLQESFTWQALVGGAMILSGIVVVNRK